MAVRPAGGRIMISFLRTFWLAFVAAGEKRLWFSGVLACISLTSLWLYAISTMIIYEPASLEDEWGIVVLIVGMIIPMLMALVVGYGRAKLGMQPVKQHKTFEHHAYSHRIVGLIWLFNVSGFIVVLVLASLFFEMIVDLLKGR